MCAGLSTLPISKAFCSAVTFHVFIWQLEYRKEHDKNTFLGGEKPSEKKTANKESVARLDIRTLADP
jgi:hypothetical protein